TRRGVGTFVSGNVNAKKFEGFTEDLLDSGQLQQIYQLRIEIESGAASLAAEHRTAKQLKSLEVALLKTDEAVGDWCRAPTAAVLFQLAVTQRPNNPNVVRLMQHLSYVIHNALHTLRYSTPRTQRIGHIEQEHHEIFEAIKHQTAALARQAM